MKNSHNKRIVFADNPIELFAEWFGLARQTEPNDPDAMSLATVSADGTPNVRMVLCKSFNHDGVRFFTNTESTKGQELAGNPNAALCFHWKTLHRQVRVRGAVSKLPAADDDAYFHDRHRETQLGAWASAQSQAARQHVTAYQAGLQRPGTLSRKNR